MSDIYAMSLHNLHNPSLLETCAHDNHNHLVTHTTGAKDVESTKLNTSFEVAPAPCQINVNYNVFFFENRNPTYKNM